MESFYNFLSDTSDVIAFIALITSFITAVWGFKASSKLNKINLKANIFDAIFWDLLFKKYVPLFNKINEWQISSKDLDKLENFIIELKQKLDIYKLINKKFYENLIILTKDLDDFIVSVNENNLTRKEKKKINDLIKKIYSIFLEEYLN